MWSYVLKRLLFLPLFLMGLSLLAFGLVNLAPSDPAEVALRVNEIVPTDEAVAEMRRELGLQASFPVRYLRWLGDLARGDLGVSWISRRPVIEDFRPAAGPTVRLALTALALIVLTAGPLGVLGAVYAGRWPDRLGRLFIFISMAVPNYWAALLLLWLFAVKLDLLPLGGLTEPGAVILPALTLALQYAGTYVRFIRGAMLSNLQSGWAAYGRARGLSESRVLIRHVLANSLQSAVTALGMSIPKLIAGTVVVESIFAWPGLGRLGLKAILDRDLPMIQAYILLLGTLFVIFNLAADLIQTRLDPRLRLSGAGR